MHSLMIKDLSATLELDRAAMTAVHGGTSSNAATQTTIMAQEINVPVGNGSDFGKGSATNLTVHVDADQTATSSNYQYNGDIFAILAPFGLRRA